MLMHNTLQASKDVALCAGHVDRIERDAVLEPRRTGRLPLHDGEVRVLAARRLGHETILDWHTLVETDLIQELSNRHSVAPTVARMRIGFQ